MHDLQTFFARLANWEGVPVTALVTPWRPADLRAVDSDFRQAFRRSGLLENPPPGLLLRDKPTRRQPGSGRCGDKNGTRLRQFRIERCSGQAILIDGFVASMAEVFLLSSGRLRNDTILKAPAGSS